MQISFTVKVTMWKTITIILCTLIVRSNPLGKYNYLQQQKHNIYYLSLDIIYMITYKIKTNTSSYVENLIILNEF